MNAFPNPASSPWPNTLGQLRFGDKKPHRKTEDTIQHALQGCVYGKDLEMLLQPETGFDVFRVRNHTIHLANYYHIPQDGPELRGVCLELAGAVGRRLKKSLGKTHEIFYVLGNGPKYFSAPGDFHTYLRVMSKSSPRESFYVDPSFDVIGKRRLPRGYHADELRTLDTEFPNPQRLGLNTKRSEELPLGYLQELAPQWQSINPKNPNDGLLFLHFIRTRHNGVEPQLSLLTEKHQEQPIPRSWLLTLPTGSLLRQFLEKITADVRRPESKQADAAERFSIHTEPGLVSQRCIKTSCKPTRE